MILPDRCSDAAALAGDRRCGLRVGQVTLSADEGVSPWPENALFASICIVHAARTFLIIEEQKKY